MRLGPQYTPIFMKQFPTLFAPSQGKSGREKCVPVPGAAPQRPALSTCAAAKLNPPPVYRPADQGPGGAAINRQVAGAMVPPQVYRPALGSSPAAQRKVNAPIVLQGIQEKSAPEAYKPPAAVQPKIAPPPIAGAAMGNAHRPAVAVPVPRSIVQLMQHSYGTRLKDKQQVLPGQVHSPPPQGFTLVGKYELMGQSVDTNAKIYQRQATLKNGKKGRLLWWEYPLHQIDDFVYTGDRDTDIRDCNAKMQATGYTWHHAGWPIDEQQGTMQLVPTDEHAALGHIGGVLISKGEVAG